MKFTTTEEKCREKFLLFQNSDVLIYPSDDDTVFRVLKKSDFSGKRLGWSLTDSSAPFYVSSIEHAADHTTIHYTYEGKEGTYTLNYISEASIENSITCAVTALYLGLTPDELAERMDSLEPVAMRLEVKEGRNGCILQL